MPIVLWLLTLAGGATLGFVVGQAKKEPKPPPPPRASSSGWPGW